MRAPMRAPLLLVGLAACQTASAPAERGVTLRGDGDGVTLVRTAEGCRADDVAIRVHDGEAHGGGWHLTPAAAGRALALRDAPMARIVEDPGPPRLIAFLDPIGVPLARVTIAADGVAVAGADRAPLGRVEPAARELRWVDATGRATASITGTDDLAIAAALVAPPSLPMLGRAVVACAQLAATSPEPAKSP